MGKYLATFTLVVGLLAGAVTVISAEEWAVEASWTDACSCNPSCPCIYGSEPTQGFCEGNGLVEIKKGHYGDINLDGISAVVAYHMGKDGAWTKYYVSDKASDQQVKAMTQLTPAVMQFLAGSKVLSVETVPVSVERTASHVKFSVPASSVELEVLTNAAGKPIKIVNLPAKEFPGPQLIDYTQYRTIKLVHKDGDGAFRHAKTSGFTARMNESSKDWVVHRVRHGGIADEDASLLVEDLLEARFPHEIDRLGELYPGTTIDDERSWGIELIDTSE